MTKLSALFLSATFLLAACSNKMEDINTITSRMGPLVDKAEDVTIIYSNKAVVEARLFATEFIRNEGAKPPYVDMNKGLKVEFFDDSTSLKSTLTARNGRYYEQQGNVIIRDSVVIINDKNERLDTEELVWNQQLQKFYTEKFVRVTTPTQVFFGNGMEATQDFSWYRIKKLTGTVLVDKNEVPGAE